MSGEPPANRPTSQLIACIALSAAKVTLAQHALGPAPTDEECAYLKACMVEIDTRLLTQGNIAPLMQPMTKSTVCQCDYCRARD